MSLPFETSPETKVTFLGGGSSSTFPNPPADNTTALGTSALRYSQGFFGSSGIRIGDGTNGANITADAADGTANLIITGGTTGRPVLSSGVGTYSLAVHTGYTCVGDTRANAIAASGLILTTTEVWSNGYTLNVGRSGNRTGTIYASNQGISLAGASLSATGGNSNEAQQVTKPVTAIANAVATGVLTITIPNAAHSAIVRVTLAASLGLGGGGVDIANQATAGISYDIAVTRLSGANAVAAISAAYGSTGSATSATANSCTVTAAMSAVSGAVGATNTFTVNATISRGAGTSTNHTCLVKAEIINSNASGITLS